MAYKYDFKKIYENRIEEIDKQIKTETRRKHWGMKANLEREKKDLQAEIDKLKVKEVAK